MTVYGGYHDIKSMKQVQTLSRESSAPFDIIYTGGEALGCNFECGKGMLPTNAMREQAIRERVKGTDCAYLFAKGLLRAPNDPATETRATMRHNQANNVAILNSLGGGSVYRGCKTAVDTVDYAVYRDHDPLVPDSAVMTKELFGDLISSMTEDVRKDIFASPPQNLSNQKYIAVQFTKEYGLAHSNKIAEVLDQVGRATNLTIVLFAAGTAPNHDSFEVYKSVASQMTASVITYEAENVWKVIATIAGAEATIATSLHVRIMSFIFFKPRITWCRAESAAACKGQKHDQFIQHWDAPDSQTLVDCNKTLPTLLKYLGENPKITQEHTKELYQHHVKAYMESFNKWSKLLNQKNDRGVTAKDAISSIHHVVDYLTGMNYDQDVIKQAKKLEKVIAAQHAALSIQDVIDYLRKMEFDQDLIKQAKTLEKLIMDGTQA
jgi:hypothetical protein